MAHELSLVDGEAEAAFAVNEQLGLSRPWHGLGSFCDRRMTPFEALRKARLEWEVGLVPLCYMLGDKTIVLSNRAAIIRKDTGYCFGVAGKRFTPIQNRTQAEIVEAMVGEGVGCVECVGALFGGAKTFWTMRVPGYLMVGGDQAGDLVEKYLILVNANDAAMALRIFWSPIRVVCNNTLMAALRRSNAANSIIVRHTGDVREHIETAKMVLRRTTAYYGELFQIFNRFRQIEVDDAVLDAFLDRILPPAIAADGENAGEPDDAAKSGKSREEIKRLFRDPDVPGVKMAGRTLWGLYNAAAHFASHHGFEEKPGRDSVDFASSRMNSLLFGGKRSKLNQAAFLACLELAAA